VVVAHEAIQRDRTTTLEVQPKQAIYEYLQWSH
jgi:hypothetical protein